MVEFESVTERQQRMWATGDFHRIGVAQLGVGERLCRSLRVRAGERVLDVAAGAGNTALAAARRFADVLATDYVPELLSRAEQRAETEGLRLTTEVADAQRLPYDDGSFDVVTTTFGAMFAPDQPRTAAELARVLRPGGRLGMANWTPTGYVGELFALVAQHQPPPEGVLPPTRWGDPTSLAELLEPHGMVLTSRVRHSDFVYPSATFMLEYWQTWFGPTATLYAALDEPARERLTADLLALFAAHNEADDGTVLISAPYLEVVAVKR